MIENPFELPPYPCPRCKEVHDPVVECEIKYPQPCIGCGKFVGKKSRYYNQCADCADDWSY